MRTRFGGTLALAMLYKAQLESDFANAGHNPKECGMCYGDLHEDLYEWLIKQPQRPASSSGPALPVQAP